MSSNADRHAYFRSLGDELVVQAHRVRHLIGDAHWLSDGHHKEYLLKSLLQRHLPGNTLIGGGFVVDPVGGGVSKEQDLMIVDTIGGGPLFDQGGLLIVTPGNVRATVSVKSSMRGDTVTDSVDNQRSVRDVLRVAGVPPHNCWCAAYFFQADVVNTAQTVYNAYEREVLKRSMSPPAAPTGAPPGPDMLCCASGLIVVARAQGMHQSQREVRLLGYMAGELATAVFISILLDHLSEARGAGSSDLPALVEHESIRPIDPSEHVFINETGHPL